MALTDIKGLIGYPSFLGITTAFPTIFLVDGDDERFACVFQVPLTGTIDRLSICLGTVTTAQSLDVAIETVSAVNGDPTGTDYGGSSPGAVASPTTNNAFEATLATPATAVRGDVVAMVVDFTATTGSVNFTTIRGDFRGSVGRQVPYADHFTTLWIKSAVAIPCFSVRYDDGTYVNVGGVPAVDLSTLTISYRQLSDPDEHGNVIIPPVPMRATGFWWVGNAGDCDIRLYDSDDTVLATTSIDTNQDASGFTGVYYERFDVDVELTAGSTYRLAVLPTTNANFTIVEIFTFLSQAHQDGWSGGQDVYATSRKDAEADWDDDTASRINLGLLIDQLDDGVSAGAVFQRFIRGAPPLVARRNWRGRF